MPTRFARSFVRIAGLAAVGATPCLAQTTQRVDVDSSGQVFLTGVSSARHAVSADGRYTTFDVTLFTQQPPTSFSHVARHDRVTGLTSILSVAPNGEFGNSYSAQPHSTPDGRYVVFQSYATNLVAGLGGNAPRILVRDTVLGVTTWDNPSVSGGTSNGNHEFPRITPDGRWIVFQSNGGDLIHGDNNGHYDVFVRDRQFGTTVRASDALTGDGNAQSYEGSISDDGRYVCFGSFASNLVAGDTNDDADVFVRDLVAGTTSRVGLDANGAQLAFGAWAPRLSGDGRYVAFVTDDPTAVPGDPLLFVDVILRDLSTGTNELVSGTWNGAFGDGSVSEPIELSPDGRFVAFSSPATNLVPGDTNGVIDVFLRDRQLGSTERINVTTSGQQVPPTFLNDWHELSLSPDGRFVSFSEWGHLAVGIDSGSNDLYLRDRGGVGTTLETYCTAKVNSSGCTPVAGATGLPSASGATAFTLTASRVLPNKLGIFFWGANSAAIPFGGGTLCVAPPVVRLPPQNSGGSTTSACSGGYFFPFTASYASAHGLGAGSTVHGQFWSRDPSFDPPNNIGLTDAVRFTLGL
ncbi:MAG: hypothetical protein L6Q99_19020 [Planctomycetes bacterium]|nr:hypothetical protein [Planctomycetota bacterium]